MKVSHLFSLAQSVHCMRFSSFPSIVAPGKQATFNVEPWSASCIIDYLYLEKETGGDKCISDREKRHAQGFYSMKILAFVSTYLLNVYDFDHGMYSKLTCHHCTAWTCTNNHTHRTQQWNINDGLASLSICVDSSLEPWVLLHNVCVYTHPYIYAHAELSHALLLIIIVSVTLCTTVLTFLVSWVLQSLQPVVSVSYVLRTVFLIVNIACLELSMQLDII